MNLGTYDPCAVESGEDLGSQFVVDNRDSFSNVLVLYL